MRGELERLAAQVVETFHDTVPSKDGYRCQVSVRTVPKASKRLQMAEGIRAAQTDIIVFADDDALCVPAQRRAG